MSLQIDSLESICKLILLSFVKITTLCWPSGKRKDVDVVLFVFIFFKLIEIYLSNFSKFSVVQFRWIVKSNKTEFFYLEQSI